MEKSCTCLKSIVKSGDVDEDESHEGLEHDGEVQDPVAHASLEDGPTARPGRETRSRVRIPVKYQQVLLSSKTS